MCPAMAAVLEIKSGGWDVSPDAVMIGGRGGEEVVCDSVNFYVTSRRLRIARLQIDAAARAKNNPADMDHIGDTFARTCDQMFGKHWKDGRPISRGELYERIMSEVGAGGIRAQIFAILDAIAALERLVMNSAIKSARSLTLPDIVLPAEADLAAFYVPAAARAICNRVVDYVNQLNINAILAEPVVARIKPLTDPAPETLPRPGDPWYFGQFPASIDDLSSAFSAEIGVAEYAKSAEKFHVVVAKKMCEVFEVIEKMTDGLAGAR